MSPDGNLGGDMNEPEMARLALNRLTIMASDNVEGEECLVIAGPHILLGNSSDLLVGRHRRRSDIVCKKVTLGANMEKLDGILVANYATTSGLGDGLGGDDLPLVVKILVWVTCNLLALTADSSILILERILVLVRMQEDLGILVLEGDGVIVADL